METGYQPSALTSRDITTKGAPLSIHQAAWQARIHSADSPHFPRGARKLAEVLATFARRLPPGSPLYPGLDRLMARTGMSKPSVMRNLKILRDAGYLIRATEGRRKHRAEYVLTTPETLVSDTQSLGLTDTPSTSYRAPKGPCTSVQEQVRTSPSDQETELGTPKGVPAQHVAAQCEDEELPVWMSERPSWWDQPRAERPPVVARTPSVARKLTPPTPPRNPLIAGWEGTRADDAFFPLFRTFLTLQSLPEPGLQPGPWTYESIPTVPSKSGASA